MNDNSVDFDFALGWDNFEGNLSMKLANNILIYGESNKKKIKNALDLCAGTGNFVQALSERGIKCYATETEDAFISSCKTKAPDCNIRLTKTINEIPFKDSFDLISCNHNTINSLESLEEWKNLFKNTNKHLSSTGIFIFDYYTKQKLSNWNETKSDSSSGLDMICEVKTEKFNTKLTYTFYVPKNGYLAKTKNTITQIYYENNIIFDELKKAGFKNILKLNENLEPLENLENEDKIYIIASKK